MAHRPTPLLPGQTAGGSRSRKTSGSDRRVGCGDGAGMGGSEWGSLKHRAQCVQAASLLGIELPPQFSDRTLPGPPRVVSSRF